MYLGSKHYLGKLKQTSIGSKTLKAKIRTRDSWSLRHKRYLCIVPCPHHPENDGFCTIEEISCWEQDHELDP